MDFCKERYFFEINRKHQLTSSLALPVGLLTVIGGIVACFLKHISVSNNVVQNAYNKYKGVRQILPESLLGNNKRKPHDG